MKWVYQLRNKTKPVLLLTAIVVLIVASNFWEKANMSKMNHAFSSIYNDRLIPAASLFQIHDLLYSKRLGLERFLISKTDKPQNIREELQNYDRQIDSIVREYEATYLVAEESRSLNTLKEKLSSYNQLEESLLMSPHPSLTGYEEKMVPLFNEIRVELQLLSSIQTDVGKELLTGTEAITSNAKTLNELQIAVVVTIMLVVQALILASPSFLTRKAQNFHLN